MKNKKKTSKTTKKLPVLPFNKKNMLALADTIFSDKNGEVSFLKLCYGTLKNGKDGGRTTHCAIGEAYFTFVNRDMNKVVKDTFSTYQSQYELGSEGETAAAIDALVDRAQLKSPTQANKKKLAQALDGAVNENDNGGDDELSLDIYVSRSEGVAQVFRDQVAPLLK